MIAPTLETPRLILRALSPDDWEAYAEAWADPRMTRFIGGQPRYRPTSWGKFLQAAGLWSILGYGYWSFIDRETGRLAGNGGLAQFERGVAALAGHAEAGWAFVPDVWGKAMPPRPCRRSSNGRIAGPGWPRSGRSSMRTIWRPTALPKNAALCA